MSISIQDAALSIIHFLKANATRNAVEADLVDSLDVAIDCIADAFAVDKEQSGSVFQGRDLTALLTVAASATVADSPTVATSASAETIAKANDLKLEGNKAMASRDFAGAVAKYTEAIAVHPDNAVLFSNRAAAHSSNQDHQSAVEDAQKALELDPTYSKAYSRLGLAKYALGESKASMEAYKKGLEVEGDAPSAAMQKGYQTALNRVKTDLESQLATTETETPAEAAPATGLPAGFPDLSSMFGGAGGMPDLSSMMSNPAVAAAAQNLMSNPGALQGLMSNPALRQMAESMGNGNGPDMAELMNNPMLKNLASQFMGGNPPQ